MRVGLPARTLRYYDRIGLVCPPRSPAGYRLYGPEEEAGCASCAGPRRSGLSLEQIGELLALAERDAAQAAPEVERLLEARHDRRPAGRADGVSRPPGRRSKRPGQRLGLIALTTR